MSESIARLPQSPLSPAERSALRARAHNLDPVVMISSQGLTAGVIAEIDRALDSHGLIKVRVLDTGRDERDALMARVCEAVGAQPIQHIGKILVVFREKPAAPETAPAASTVRAPRPVHRVRTAAKSSSAKKAAPAKKRAPARKLATAARKPLRQPATAGGLKFPSRKRATPGTRGSTTRSGRPGSPARASRRGR